MTTMWDEFRAAVQAIDVTVLDRAGLDLLAGEIGTARAVLDGLEARMATGMRRLGASEASTAETLRRQTGCSAREAKHRTRRAEILGKMPNVAEAFSSGRLTGEHASSMARAAAETSPEAVDGDVGLLAETESVPADVASGKARDWVRRRQTGDDLQRLHQWQRRNRSLMFGAGEGGMVAGIAKFDQVSGAQFQNLVEALADRLYRADGGRDNPHARTRAQCRLDALLSLVGLEPAPPPGPEPSDTAPGVRPARPTAPRSTLPGTAQPALSGACEPAGAGRSSLPGTAQPALPSVGEPARRVAPGPGPRQGLGSGLRSATGCSCGGGFGPKAQLCIVMDLEYLATDGERGRCEIPGVGAMARSELERLGCDADVYGLIFDGRGLPLYHGRKTRRVSPQQWRALVARDRGCVICGAAPGWCQAHHVRYWILGGRTDIDNLALVCHQHHRWIHDNRITLRWGSDGWRAPPGPAPPSLTTRRPGPALQPA
ncbi:MAG: DUF222 domain-containing protein [Acidimicrobiaceae bacterium]|nr:DUF222 domain-containing protein [Acidimicrobiaceae bacterium]MDE0515183.1 DUF222 domain-containing protein [Acidimicrobiaceae bacterium]MYF41688.1 DUF222 domain-containing protein [Acidimicrobiaceae bacterium]